ncbi:hypothetical protein [Pseudomonas sp. LRF_L74]|uniref:hypothetical protein n=1 Tax=Pseudomonas sp. LRF_L74 TaxID=3369422 RepID=UPI003F608101
MTLLRILAAAFMFFGLLAGCLAILLLVILMVRFPLLPIAVLLALLFQRFIGRAGISLYRRT